MPWVQHLQGHHAPALTLRSVVISHIALSSAIKCAHNDFLSIIDPRDWSRVSDWRCNTVHCCRHKYTN